MGAVKFRPLRPEDVEVRVGQCSDKGCSLLLYKDARVDARLLDETVGPENWQNAFESIDGKLFCKVGIRFQDGEWVWKSDTGTPSNMEAQKGEASDAFKRACFKWGLGRELYTAPRIWVAPENCNLRKGNNGRMQCYDDFRVTEMEVDDGQIVKLTVVNMSKKGVTVYGTAPTSGKAAPKKAARGKQEEMAGSPLEAAYKRMGTSINEWCARHGITDPDEIKKKKDGVKKRPEWESQKKSIEYIESIAREFDDD